MHMYICVCIYIYIYIYIYINMYRSCFLLALDAVVRTSRVECAVMSRVVFLFCKEPLHVTVV